MISINTYSLLRQELEPVYATFPRDDQCPAWEEPNCAEWSRRALPIVRSILGASVERVVYQHDYRNELQNNYNLPEGYHAYLADLTAPDSLIICGTYLQFAFPGSDNREHVLITPISGVSHALEEAGVDKKAWPFFRPDLYLGRTITIEP